MARKKNTYADLYLLPIKKKNVTAYKKLAKTASFYFVKHGALKYREYIASDLAIPELLPFTKLMKLKKDETAIFATVEFESEAARKKAMKAIMTDEEFVMKEPKKPIFDMKRMSYGGFKLIVEKD